MRPLAALFLWSWAALSQSTSPGSAAYRRAEEWFEKGRFQDSLTELDHALSLDPKLVPALTLKAKLAMSIKRYDVAHECLDRALAADPKAWYAQFLIGFLHYQQNQMPQAVEELEKARRLHPADPRSALYLGLANETLGRPAEALRLYEEAIRLEEASTKPNAGPWIICARLLIVRGDLNAAAKRIAQALRIEPNSRDAHFESARLLLKQGLPVESAKEGETALKLAGEVADRQVHYLLVQAYRAAGREKDADRHAEAIRSGEQ